MTSIEIVGWQRDPVSAVAQAASDHELQIATVGTLKSLPGSRHWHLKKPKQAGTLEITYWPQESRLWVCYHSNRTGSWVPGVAPLFAESLATKLGGRID